MRGAFLCLGLALACSSPDPPPERVVLISIDTLRADHVGAYGAANAHTRTLDQLAETGVRFETAISPAPLTLPSHTTLLTGLDPPQHGVRHNGIYRLPAGVDTLATSLHEQGFATAAFVGAIVLGHRYGLDRGFDHYDDRVVLERSRRGLRGFAERPADAVVDAALAWLEDAPERFFLFVHLYDPHFEYQPPPGFAAAFPGDPYAGEIAFADQQIGRLLEALPGPERTLVVVSSDHGDSLGEHGEATHSHFVYDSTQRVPLIMRGPGLPAGTLVPGMVALRDVAPTILDLLGLPPLPGTEGRSLVPRIRGRPTQDEPSYLETLANQFDWSMSPLLGLRGVDWKYVRAPRPELYDLRADPGETHNLAAAQPDRVRELDAMLEQRLAGARSAVPNLEPEREERARLEALGYVGGLWEPEAWHADPPGQVGGRDPKDGIEVITAVHEADWLQSQGRSRAALAVLARLDGEPSAVYNIVRAAAAISAGDGPLAEASARAALAAAPQLSAGHLKLGSALLLQGRLDDARGAYEGVLALDPENPTALTALGAIAQAQGDEKEAIELYRHAIDASSIEAPWRLATLYLRNGRLEEADAVLAGASEESFATDVAVLSVALAEAGAGRDEQARAWLARGVREHPDAGELRLAYAQVLLAARETEAARQQLEAALTVSEKAAKDASGGALARAEFLRARALAALGRREEAGSALQIALAEPDLLNDQERQAAQTLARQLGMAAPSSEDPG